MQYSCDLESPYRTLSLYRTYLPLSALDRVCGAWTMATRDAFSEAVHLHPTISLHPPRLSFPYFRSSAMAPEKPKPVVIIFTDGSCFNNGKPNAYAGLGVWFGPDDKRYGKHAFREQA